jgi:CheY-like chemotaxis protein
LIEEFRHELAIALPPEPIRLLADPVRLAQVFSNLLNNAAKYTPPGGHIRVSAERDKGEVAVSIADDGLGIAPETLPYLFTVFSQAESAAARSRGGLGIGLALVRELVRLHGGTVEARSEGIGRGSTFIVRLEVLADSQPAARDEAIASIAPPKRRVLVADDLREGSDTFALLLRSRGHEVRTAHDGEEALAAAEAFKPDVVFLDLGMPRLDGYEVCRRIRAAPWGAGMHTVALSGWGGDEHRLRAREAGFDRHCVKPLDPRALDEILATSD